MTTSAQAAAASALMTRKARGLGLGRRRRARPQRHHDLGHAAVLQVVGMAEALAAIADHGHALALDQVQIGVGVVVDAHQAGLRSSSLVGGAAPHGFCGVAVLWGSSAPRSAVRDGRGSRWRSARRCSGATCGSETLALVSLMRQLHVRNLPDEVVKRLKQQAVRHGRSMEAEHRLILEHARSPSVAAADRCSRFSRPALRRARLRARASARPRARFRTLSGFLLDTSFLSALGNPGRPELRASPSLVSVERRARPVQLRRRDRRDRPRHHAAATGPAARAP